MITLRRLIFILSFSCAGLNALSVGSDHVVSREGNVVFAVGDNDNELNGFAYFENGFELVNENTTCTFDSLLRVGGTIDLNGGALYLQKDLILDSVATFTDVGAIYGNGYKIDLSESVTFLEGRIRVSSIRTRLPDWEDDPRGNVHTVDWNYTSTYLLSGSSDWYLNFYKFDGDNFEHLQEIALDDNPFVIRGHPFDDYFAVGLDSATSFSEMQVYRVDNDVLTLVDYDALGTQDIRAAAWSHDGNYIAVGLNSSVGVYSFDGTTLTPEDSLDDGTATIQQKALCWDQTGGYFAVGTANQLRVFSYDSGTSTIAVAQTEATGGPNIEALDWSQTGSFIAVGTDQTGPTDEQVRVYEYDSGANTITKLQGINVGAQLGGAEVHWNSDATKLAVSTQANASGPEVQIHDFNKTTYELTFADSYEMSDRLRAIRWAPNDKYLAVGSHSDYVTIFEYDYGQTDPTLLLDNVTLLLRTALSLRMGTTIQGDCMIDGRDNKLTLEGDGVITVTSDAALTLKNLDLRGLVGNTFSCYDDTGSIVLENCKIRLNDDFNFSNGSILFNQDVVFTGTNTFIYSSRMGSTISANSYLAFDLDSTLSYDPTTVNKDLLYFTDETSALYFNGSTLFSTSTGIRFTRGTLFLDNGVTFSCDGTKNSEFIAIGNGVAASDMSVKILSGCEIQIYGGLNYDNAT